MRVLALLLGLAVRRWLNRFSAGFQKAPKEGAPRSGTARKSGGFSVVLSVFLLLVILLQGTMVSTQLLTRIAASADATSVQVDLDKLQTSWAADGERLTRALGAVLLVVALTQLALAFGAGQQDLGRVEWTFEWLFTFPASTSALLFAKLAEYAVVNVYTWVMTFPLLGVASYAAGAGTWTLPLALAASLCFSFVLAAVRLLLETWLRTRFSLERLKNLQAASTLAGAVLLMGLFAAGVTPAIPASAFQAILDFPSPALWIPLALPATVASTPVMLAPLAVAAALSVALGLAGCVRMLRDGLLNASSAFQGSRGRRVPAAPVGGVLAKDLRVLVRDRNFLVQTLAVPLLVLAFQLFLNPGMVAAILSDFRHTAAAAFGVGAYVLLCGATQVLGVEGQTLWLLYTFPVGLDRVLLRKALLWSGLGGAYTLAALAAALVFAPPRDWTSISDAALALVLVGLYAFLAAAIGALGTDPLKEDPRRRLRPDMVYLLMLLAGVFGWMISSAPAWPRLVLLVFSALLVLALWQKLRDRLPYLLDPAEAPPPKLALSDGLIALIAFFAGQAALSGLFVALELPVGWALLLGYSISGAAVALLSLAAFKSAKVPDLLRACGLRPQAPGAFLRSLGWGLLAGAGATAVAAAYLPILRARRPELLEHPPAGAWVAALAVGAAPLVEEFIFRGLLYQGLRRTWGVAPSVLASAALFAAAHPPASALPVFALGVATSLAFERARWLLAPVLAHAAYNAAVVLVLNR